MHTINLALFNIIHNLAGHSHFLDALGVFIADTFTYVLILVGAYFLWRLRGWRQRIFGAIEIALAVLLGDVLINTAIRHFYHHLRPFAALNFVPLILNETPNNSFASGHMAILFAMSTVIFCLNRKWGSWLLGLSLIVGIARVYVGIHWPFDIIGGALIGIISGVIVHRLVRKYWLSLEGGIAEMVGTDS
jgi:undecaprenyl-diphosphatase